MKGFQATQFEGEHNGYFYDIDFLPNSKTWILSRRNTKWVENDTVCEVMTINGWENLLGAKPPYTPNRHFNTTQEIEKLLGIS